MQERICAVIYDRLLCFPTGVFFLPFLGKSIGGNVRVDCSRGYLSDEGGLVLLVCSYSVRCEVQESPQLRKYCRSRSWRAPRLSLATRVPWCWSSVPLYFREHASRCRQWVGSAHCAPDLDGTTSLPRVNQWLAICFS